jgi:hypothetical protein
MPVSSLNRFTVPLSTNDSASSQGLLMPKLKYRFRVILENFGVPGTPTTELTKQVMNVTRPSLTFEEIKLPVYNSTVKLAGKHVWANATLTLRDDVTNAVTQLVGQQLQKQFDFFEQSSAASGIDYKFTMRVELLDGGNGANTPTVLEAFDFLGCYLSGVEYQGGDYASATDPMDIKCTVVYDNALQYGAGGAPTGIGQQIGRTIRTLALGG